MTKIDAMKELLNYVTYSKRFGIFRWKIYVGGRCRVGEKAGGIDWGGYDVICFKGQRIKVHRLLWFMVHEELPEILDHIDGDKSNNRIENLRASNITLNSRNRKEHRAGNPLGVSFRKDNQKWVAQCWNGKKKIYLGQYSTMEEAKTVFDNFHNNLRYQEHKECL